jgi:hypothetical protein
LNEASIVSNEITTGKNIEVHFILICMKNNLVLFSHRVGPLLAAPRSGAKINFMRNNQLAQGNCCSAKDKNRNVVKFTRTPITLRTPVRK